VAAHHRSSHVLDAESIHRAPSCFSFFIGSRHHTRLHHLSSANKPGETKRYCLCSANQSQYRFHFCPELPPMIKSEIRRKHKFMRCMCKPTSLRYVSNASCVQGTLNPKAPESKPVCSTRERSMHTMHMHNNHLEKAQPNQNLVGSVSKQAPRDATNRHARYAMRPMLSHFDL
jgi:hypothetical protein